MKRKLHFLSLIGAFAAGIWFAKNYLMAEEYEEVEIDYDEEEGLDGEA